MRSIPTLPLLAVAAFTSLVSMRLCDAMLPVLAQAFAVSNGEAAIVISAYSITFCALHLIGGALGDRYGKLRILMLATGISALTTLVASQATSLTGLSLARAATGAAAAGIVPLALAWIGDTVPLHDRQVVLARFSGATVSGIMVGAWAGGFLTETIGWRGAFVAIAPLFAAASLVLWRNVDQGPPSRSAGSDPYGRQVATLLAPSWARWVLGAAVLEGVFAFGTLAFLPSALHRKLGISLADAGAALALFGLGGLIYSRVSAVLLRWFDGPSIARLGGGLLALGFLVMAWMPSWSWVAAGSLVGGLGFYCLHNTLQVHATQLSTTSRGLAVSWFGFSFFLGQSLGIPLAGWVLDRAPPAWCYVAAALSLLTLGFAFARQLHLRQQAETPGL